MIAAEVDSAKKTDYDLFLKNYKSTLKSAFYEVGSIDKFSLKRGFPKEVWAEIMSAKPLSVAVPMEYGGRGLKVSECLGMLAASSYQSLPLSLTFGINLALFLEPFAKYGQEEYKKEVFDRFIHKANLGGLMITEPDYGSDALNMRTYCSENENGYHIKGTKHWQGLTGWADYWIMTCRKNNGEGNLGRDIEFFVVDDQDKSQHINVKKLYNNLGLYGIPYGLNEVDINVQKKQKLIPESTGLKLMMDLLHRSRLQFPGMGMGFLQRIMEDAMKHCRERFVGGKPLLALDKVKHQLSSIQSAFVICSAMCFRSSQFSGIDNNVAGDAIEANSMKAYVTDLMFRSANTLVQVCGARGYEAEHFGSRGLVDARPFRIFEGSNEMLYSQISEMICKKMLRAKESNLLSYLKSSDLTKSAVTYFKDLINFNIDGCLSQRQQVDLGQVLARIVNANYVLSMGDKGFNPEMISNCLMTIKQEVSTLLSSFNSHTTVSPIDDFGSESSWLTFS